MSDHWQDKALLPVVRHQLTPPEAEAVRLFTDPLSPTYGKKKLSSDRAGADYTMWRNDRVAHALADIERDRSERGEHVATFLEHNSADAAMELVSQLGFARDIEVHDPQEAFDRIGDQVARLVHQQLQEIDGMDEDTVAGIVDSAMARALKESRMLLAEMNQTNRTAIAAAKERRAAAELILAYHLGTPQQKVKLEAELAQTESESVLDLSQLSDEDLDELRQGLHDVMKIRKGVT